MGDAIIVRELRVPARVGVTEQERSRAQMLLIDLEVEADLARAAETDDVADTVDYHALVRDVDRAARDGEYHLLERLARKIIGLIADNKRVARVSVTIAKEAPPLDEEVARVAVRMEWAR